MAITVYKTFASGEILTAADLNSSFSQIVNNGADLVFPITEAADFDGYEVILDADQDTSITSDTDDQIDYKLGGTDYFRMTVGGFIAVAAAIVEAEGAAVASATTTDIWANDGNTVHITGTTTITSFGTAPQAGAWKKVIFDGALTLTHGANLSLQGSASITTSADDIAFVYADTTTQFDVLYFKKDGGAIAVGAASTLTGTTLASNVVSSSLTSLGTITSLVATSATISGGAITGITDLTVADGGTGNSSATAYAVQCGGTTSAAAHQSIASVGTAGQVLTSNGASNLPTFQTGGAVIQMVSTQSGAVATGTTVIPQDDTIPQNTEGDEYMTRAITPLSASNNLKITVTWCGASSNAQTSFVVALFQDSTANALAVVAGPITTDNYTNTFSFTHIMAAGTTSSTTFKVRAGGAGAATTTFNGSAGARRYGGVAASSIVVEEFKP